MKLFISYSRDDAGNFAKHIHRYMRENGHAVFIDVNSITIGDPWARSIEKNISECDIFIVILTPDSLRSSHVESEVLQAQRENKIIVPCIHEHVDYGKIKWGLEKIQGVEFSDKYELALYLYPKITNYENKTSVVTNEKIISINDNQQETKIQEDVSTHIAQWYLDKAKDFEDLGQYDRALKQYEKAIEKEPYSFLLAYNKALFLDRIGKVDEALKAIEQAIDLEPKNTNIWYYKAGILEKLQKYEEALKALDIDLKLDPKDVKSWTNKAKLLEQLKRYDEAIAYYDKVLAIDVNNEEAIKNKRISEENLKKQMYSDLISKIDSLFYQQKDYSTVITLCDQAIDIYGENYIFYLYKANSLQQVSRYVEAVNYYDKVLAIDVNNEEAVKNKEIAVGALNKEKFISVINDIKRYYYENKDYNKVISLSERAIEIEQYNSDPYLYKGLALFKMERYEEAIQCYDKALEIDPNDNSIKKNKEIATREINKEKFTYIIKEIEKYHENKDHSKVIELCDDIEESINNPILQRYKGDASYNLENFKQALQCYNKVLEIEPKNADVLNKRKIVKEELDKKLDEQRNTTYSFINSWGRKGKGDGEFNYPSSISVDLIQVMCM